MRTRRLVATLPAVLLVTVLAGVPRAAHADPPANNQPPVCTTDQAAGPAQPARTPARHSDFNGDRRADLATIAVRDEEATPAKTASVFITGPDDAVVCRQVIKLAARTETQDISTADLNDDGRADLIDLVPGYGVVVYYGDRDGLADARSQTIRNPLTNDFDFGWSVASADFDHDGYPDIALGAPRDTDDAMHTSRNDSIFIYRGGPNGLRTQHPQQIRSPNHHSLFFGRDLYAGQFTNDRRADLVEVDRAQSPTRPRVVFMRSTKRGFTRPTAVSSLVGNVVVGNVVSSHADDLLISNAAGIHVLPGRNRGLGTPELLPGTAGLGTLDGLMDTNSDGRLDALIAGPGPTVDGQVTSALKVLLGAPGGFAPGVAQEIDVNTPDAPSCVAHGTAIGQAVLPRDVTGDGTKDLLLSASVYPTDVICPSPELELLTVGHDGLTLGGTYYHFPAVSNGSFRAI